MDRQTLFAILFFTVLGFSLRAWNLGFQCFWLEEQYTLWITGLDWIDLIHVTLTSEPNPPVYYLLAKACLLVFQADWAIRIPSLVAGTLMVPAMYLLGRTYKDEITGVWCAGVASILFPLVYYSQYGRAYALLYLFFALFLVLWIQDYRGKGESWLLWILAALCVMTHLFSMIPVGILITEALWRRLRSLPHLPLRTMVGIASLAIPLIAAFMIVASSSLVPRMEGTSYGDSTLVLLLVTPGEMMGIFFVIFSVFIVSDFILQKSEPVRRIILITAAITILAGFVLSGITPIFPRYYAATAGTILLLIACSGIGRMVDGIILPVLNDISVKIDRRHYNPPIETPPMIIIAVAIFVMLVLQYNDFSSQYLIQKYTCLLP